MEREELEVLIESCEAYTTQTGVVIGWMDYPTIPAGKSSECLPAKIGAMENGKDM